jgi:CPA1 family monovalent cation:H+ antiporter
MIHDNLLLILVLLVVSSLLVMLANKLRIAYPIFLVIGGLLISLIPGIPLIVLDPEIVFLIFLPPLLYEAAWFTSWKDFIKWWRPISMLAFGLVFLTSLIVAYIAESIIPGFSLALGFLLGGIISPPDAVAATSVMRYINVPKRIATVLEGESLINDASSLIVFRFAVLTIMTGRFTFQTAAAQFLLAAGMGVVFGLAIALIVYRMHRLLPTTASINAVLTLMSPYFMYIAAEHFHFSGVMAVVTGGLFLSYRSHEILRDGATRLQTTGVWTTIVFVLNALVFILIGLELPVIVNGLEGFSIGEAILYGLIISLIAIIVRMLWCFLLVYFPKWINYTARLDKVNPMWKVPFIIGWAGMRGVVSLASALSVPLLLPGGEPFPHRNLILFITFIVIMVTLVFQGLTLPTLIRWIKVKEMDERPSEGEQEQEIRLRLMKVALDRLNNKHIDRIGDNELLGFLKTQLEHDINITDKRLASLTCDTTQQDEIDLYHEVMRDLVHVQRQELFHMRQERVFEDEVIRKQEAQLDLDEAKVID